MTKILFYLIFFLFLNFSLTSEDAKIIDENFAKNFESGIISTGVDCENLTLNKNKTFIYKFTGDCKGWGRTISGKWFIKNNFIFIKGTLNENEAEGKKGCAGSYYKANSKKEIEVCFKNYKSGILAEFKKFPASFDFEGKIWKTTNSTIIAVSIETYLLNGNKKTTTKGLMFFNDETFGVLTQN